MPADRSLPQNFRRPAAVITHSGPFHADDVFACATLRLLVPGIAVDRTRDAQRLAAAVSDTSVAVVDVGGVYEASANNFDHHQPDFDTSRNDGSPLASFGLVWAAWGAVVCAEETGEDEGVAATIAERVDRRIGVFLDAVDVGALVVETRVGANWLLAHAYDLTDVVGDWNPDAQADVATFDAAFEEAVHWACGVLRRHIAVTQRELAAAHVVSAADDGSPLLVLEQAVPWIGHTAAHHLMVVCPGSDGHWNARAVPSDMSRFESRVLFPASWAGLRDAELASVSGVRDAVFCHRGRFVAVAQTREGALALAREALAQAGVGEGA
jgi:uncharacterized UPF0160 family protein